MPKGEKPHKPYRPSEDTEVYLEEDCPKCFHKTKHHDKNGCGHCNCKITHIKAR